MICFLGPSPRNRGTIGYLQRVRQVDQIFSSFDRIYLDFAKPPYVGLKTYFSNTRPASLVLDTANSKHVDLIESLLRDCRSIYAHSLFKIQPIERHLEASGLWNKVILDVHGTVPEEFAMADNQESFNIFSSLEKTALQKAMAFVTVSDAMSEHLKQKYSHLKFNTICLPNVSPSLRDFTHKDVSHLSKATIVYSGGADPWQNTIRMLETAQEQEESFYFKFFTHSPKAWRAQPGYKKTFEKFAPKAIWSRKEMTAILLKAQLGFVLRDDSVINQVACPTKMIEYFEHGVLPIVLQPRIGDFEKLGFKYVLLKNLPAHNRIWKESFQSDIEKNYQVAELLHTKASEGAKELVDLIKLDLDDVKEPFIKIRKIFPVLWVNGMIRRLSKVS
jgi:hypothetical protein